MKNRSPAAVLLLPFVTFGIYSLYWQVKTKAEMNKLGAKIPTAWLIIVPIANIWWLWKYCEGVEQVTGEKMSGVMAFILIFLLGIIGSAIVQDAFNKIGSSTPAAVSAAPAATPEVSAQTPTPPTDTPAAPPAIPSV